MQKITIFLSVFLAGILVMAVVVFKQNSETDTPEGNGGPVTKYNTSTEFILQDALKENFIEKETDKIRFLFPAGGEQQIEKYAAELKNEQLKFDDLFGSEVKAPLTIQIYESFDSLGVSSGNTIMGGFYISEDTTLHMSMEIESWQNILIHEYTHYRTHQFYESHDLTIDQIPTWFEEGVAEYIAGPFKVMMPSQLENITDFRKMDSTNGFQELQQKGFSPYAQSYFAVQWLVDNHGIEVIPELLKSHSMIVFYDNLESITQQPIGEFQASFLADLIFKQQQFAEKFKRAEELEQNGQYLEAENLLIGIKESSLDALDRELAETKIIEIYLNQEKYTELILKLQYKLDVESNNMRPLDFLILAELYLIDDPQKALETIQTSYDYVIPENLFYNQLVKVAQPYEQINSDQQLAGYRSLIEEELIFTEEIREEILEDLIIKYPNDF